MRLTGQSDEPGQFAQVIIHQGHISRFDGCTRTRSTHGETNVRTCQRRRVIDTVSHHAYCAVLANLGLDGFEFVFGQQVAQCLINTNLPSNGPGRMRVVTREHHGLDAQRVKFSDGLTAAVLDRIGNGKKAMHALVVRQQNDRLALFFQRRQPGFQFIKDVPVDWDTTVVLHGRIGDDVVVARKAKGVDEWYVGAITDEEERTITVKLDGVLTPGRPYMAQIYEDGVDADWATSPTALAIRGMAVDSRTQLVIHMARGGGQAIRIRPVR